MRSLRINATAVIAGLALCFSPTIASAAVTSAPTLNPLIAVGVFGSAASAQAACGAATSAAAAAGAAAVAQGQPGCVLPVVDAPPPVPVSEAPPAVLPPAGGGIGIAPILLGLLGIAALVAVLAKGDGGDEAPASPN